MRFTELNKEAKKKAAKILGGYPENWEPIPDRLQEIYKLIEERDIFHKGKEYQFFEDGTPKT